MKKLALLKEIANDVVISVAVYRELFAKIGEESEVIEAAIALFYRYCRCQRKSH